MHVAYIVPVLPQPCSITQPKRSITVWSLALCRDSATIAERECHLEASEGFSTNSIAMGKACAIHSGNRYRPRPQSEWFELSIEILLPLIR